MVNIQMTCPKCNDSEPITVHWLEGTPNVNYMPNGDPGYPGDPAEITHIDADCSCWDEDFWNNQEEYQMMENIISAWIRFQYEAEAKAMEAISEDPSWEEEELEGGIVWR